MVATDLFYSNRCLTMMMNKLTFRLPGVCKERGGEADRAHTPQDVLLMAVDQGQATESLAVSY